MLSGRVSCWAALTYDWKGTLRQAMSIQNLENRFQPGNLKRKHQSTIVVTPSLSKLKKIMYVSHLFHRILTTLKIAFLWQISHDAIIFNILEKLFAELCLLFQNQRKLVQNFDLWNPKWLRLYYPPIVKGRNQCDQKKTPNVYKSCPKMISQEKLKIFDIFTKIA